MIGTNPTGKGGIAAVATVMINEGFLQKHNILYIVSHEQRSAPIKALIFMRALTILLSKCITSKPAIVHVHASTHGSFVRKSLLLALARSFGCKTIFHLHAAIFHTYATEESGTIMRWWIQRTLQNSSKVVALSESWAQFLTGFTPGVNIQVVPNSVKLNPPINYLLEEPYRILFLGDLIPHKGVFELLAATALLRPSFPAIKMVFGGTGDLESLKTKAQELGISENIEFLGWVESDRKIQELARASIFASPAYAEGLPMAMLEAMSAGKAVVVTPVGGIPEVIKDGENGLLVPIKNAEALAQALKRLLENPTLQKNLGIKARETIAEHYSSDIVLSKLSVLYDELGALSS